MKRVAKRGLVLALLVGLCASPSAQSTPSFSGSWNILSTTGDGWASPTVTITQNDSTFSVLEAGRTRTFRLDGSETESRVEGLNGTSVLTSHAQWAGSVLSLTTTHVSPAGTWTDLEVYSLAPGPKLTVVRYATLLAPKGTRTTMAVYAK